MGLAVPVHAAAIERGVVAALVATAKLADAAAAVALPAADRRADELRAAGVVDRAALAAARLVRRGAVPFPALPALAVHLRRAAVLAAALGAEGAADVAGAGP